MKQKQQRRSKYADKTPHRYDRDSRSFLAGAWKHWPEDRRSPRARAMENYDRGLLAYGRENR